MQKTLSLLLGLIALGLSAGLALTVQKLSQSRAELARLTAVVDAQRAQGQQDAEALRKLREEHATDQEVTAQLEKRNHDLTAGHPDAAAATAAGATPEEPAKGAGLGDFMKSLSKMFKDPAMRGVMRSQQEASIRLMYGDLAKTLGLSPAEATQVMGIITDRQLDQAARGMELAGKSPEEIRKAVKDASSKETDAAYNDQLKSVLGDQRYSALQNYEKSLPDRLALNQMQQSINASGAPLNPTQSQRLLAIMQEEGAKTPAQAGAASGAGNGFNVGVPSEADFQASQDRQKEIDRRVLQRAQGVLSSDQLMALEQAQKQQLSLREMGMKMGRQFMQPAKQ